MTNGLQSLETKIQWAIDLEEIKMLMAKYCHGIDKKELETFLSIWSADADYLLPRGEGHGIEGIRRLVEKVWQQVPQCHHHITNPVVDIAGDAATARADVFYFRLTADGTHQLLSGGYDFAFTRSDGEWKIRKLEFAAFVTASPIFAENDRG
ncbi:nuclear transport factor 2 family protein [Nocardia sp. NPDC050718]|uniref:nuclear transport factor 2 family protein n=1 Tax=Nocardia sp. NPDC050718 TaxID=3155788 RepID=UPI0033F3FD5A